MNTKGNIHEYVPDRLELQLYRQYICPVDIRKQPISHQEVTSFFCKKVELL